MLKPNDFNENEDEESKQMSQYVDDYDGKQYQFDFTALSKLKQRERVKVLVLISIIVVLIVALITMVILYNGKDRSVKTEHILVEKLEGMNVALEQKLTNEIESKLMNLKYINDNTKLTNKTKHIF